MESAWQMDGPADMRRVLCLITILSAAALCAAPSAWAQGGPPFVTDDPGTPGDGHFEINIAATALQQRSSRTLVGPDVDLNYGWGDRIQLKLDMNLTTDHASGQQTQTGLGTSALGIKWRMLDGEQGGVALATYPQVLLKDPGDPHKEFFLPLEAATSIGAYQLDVEAGRSFVERSPDAWAMGLIIARACGMRFECVAEIHDTLTQGEHVTLLNLGFRHPLNKMLTLLAAAGREFGPRSEDPQVLIIFLGIQVVT
jgi:hypothetical protein